MICEAQQILARLDEIALKPNPLTELDYVDLLIQSEEREGKPGFMKRLEYLQEARQSAKIINQIKEGGGEDAEQWLKDIAQEAKENMKQRTHNFHNPKHAHVQPIPPPPSDVQVKKKWWQLYWIVL